ncbi:hypothetical protein [Phenylobacterium sp.]|uniref:hypothetical protein n=1 Tax=Phenylobacterium sp. TaxID=1871053 RepID=UPI0035AEB00A
MTAIMALAAAATLCGCATTGPVAIRPDQSLKGVADLLNDTPPGGSLNILVAHGMRADEDQDQADVRGHLAQKLHLTLQGAPRQVLLLEKERPSVRIDGNEVWKTDADWGRDLPYVDVAIYDAPGGKHVAFYSFNYWRPLARIKCRELIAYDAHLIGPSDRSRWCRDFMHEPMPGKAEATTPLVGNKWLKSEIMDWGFGDATIVMSKFEAVIRTAARDAMAVEISDVSRRVAALHPDRARGRPSIEALDEPDQRFAVITESLGGFVLLDALAAPASADELATPAPTDTADQTRDLRLTAAENILCRTQQFHMLANQITLLRLSQMQVGLGGAEMKSCLTSQVRPLSKPSIEVVAYHDPNDQLTFYNASPATEMLLGVPTINVVAPFTRIWLWFLVADPAMAHDGQKRNGRIMDMVAMGSRQARWSDGPAASPRN